MLTSRTFTALAALALMAGCSSQRQAGVASSDDLYGGSRPVRSQTVTTTTSTTTDYVTQPSYSHAQQAQQTQATTAAPQTSYYQNQPAQQTQQQDYYQPQSDNSSQQSGNGTTYITNNNYGGSSYGGYGGYGSGLGYASPIGYYRPWYRPGFSIGFGYNSFSGFSPYAAYGMASPYYYDPFWSTPGLYNPYLGFGYGYNPFGGYGYNPYFCSPYMYNPYYNPYYGYAYGYGYNYGASPYSPYGNSNYNGPDNSTRRVVPAVVRGPVTRPGSSYGGITRPSIGGRPAVDGGTGVIGRDGNLSGRPSGGRQGVNENPGMVAPGRGLPTGVASQPIQPAQQPAPQGRYVDGGQNARIQTGNVGSPVVSQPIQRGNYYVAPSQPQSAPMPANTSRNYSQAPAPAAFNSQPQQQAVVPARNYYTPSNPTSYQQQSAPVQYRQAAPSYNTPSRQNNSAPSNYTGGNSRGLGGSSGSSFGGNSGGNSGGGGGHFSGGGGRVGPR